MEQLLSLLSHPTNEKIIQTVLVFIIFYLLLQLIKITLIASINRNAENTATQIDDVIKAIVNSYGPLFYIFIPLYITSITVSINNTIDHYLYNFSIIFFAYYIVRTLTTIINFGIKKLIENDENNNIDASMFKVINPIIQVLLWIIAFIIILQNYHFNVSTIIGGLGITGIAVAFALQSVLKDIFSFFSIVFDKPYKLKDFIVINNDQMGTVKKISLRSTRLKTLQGEELIIPNQQMTDAQIRNYKQMVKRRVEFDLGVTYKTTKNKLDKIPIILEDIINSIGLCKFKYCRLKTLGQYAIIYEIVYHISTGKFDTYMKIREQINHEIINQFRKQKIDIPFPTQEIKISK